MSVRPIVRRSIAVALMLVLLALIASEPDYYTHESRTGDYTKKIYVDGRDREYRLHIPVGYDASQPLPLVFVFHGSSASASVIERETSFDRIADSVGFMVVYPEGLHRGWNIGECCRYSYMQGVNETTFVAALLDYLAEGLSIDRSRVFATGYSDGGTLSVLLACSLSDRLAAIASVSGTLFDPLPACDLARPVPVLLIHGTADSHIPYAGQSGAKATARGQHHTLSAVQLVHFWVEHDGCTDPPRQQRIGRVVRIEYSCRDAASVLFFSINGGQHGWPGGGRGWIFSPVPPSDLSASDSIAAFFMRQRLPTAPPPYATTPQ